MRAGINLGDKITSKASAKSKPRERAQLRGKYFIEAVDASGKTLWTEESKNIIVNQGLDYALDIALGGGTQDSTWFIGLMDGTPTVAATDTLASHAGWVEVSAYSEATRVAATFGATASQSISNSASPATFTINAAATVIGGVFLAADSTKGGVSGVLFSASALSGGDRTLQSTDQINITYQCDVADT